MVGRILLTIVSILAIGASVNAEVLKWIDDDGKVHYGDARQMQGRAQVVNTKISSYEYVEITKTANKGDGVTMYSTAWCGYCKKARRYFQQQGIAFTEYDIEKNKLARRAYDKMGGSGVPVILVGGSKMTGFSETRFDKLYRQAQ